MFGGMVLISVFIWSVIANYPEPAMKTVTDPDTLTISLAVTVLSSATYVIFSSKYG